MGDPTGPGPHRLDQSRADAARQLRAIGDIRIEPGDAVEPGYAHPSASEERAGFRHRFGILGRRIGIPGHPAPAPIGGAIAVATQAVRISTLASQRPSGATATMLPNAGPRPTGSRSAMARIAAIFGQPVIEPAGNRRKHLASGRPGREHAQSPRSPGARRSRCAAVPAGAAPTHRPGTRHDRDRCAPDRRS